MSRNVSHDSRFTIHDSRFTLMGTRNAGVVVDIPGVLCAVLEGSWRQCRENPLVPDFRASARSRNRQFPRRFNPLCCGRLQRVDARVAFRASLPISWENRDHSARSAWGCVVASPSLHPEYSPVPIACAIGQLPTREAGYHTTLLLLGKTRWEMGDLRSPAKRSGLTC